MTEIVLDTNTLPEPLFRLISAAKVKVKVNETNGIVNLIPIVTSKDDCPLRGLAADSSLTVDKLLAMTHDETELRQ